MRAMTPKELDERVRMMQWQLKKEILERVNAEITRYHIAQQKLSIRRSFFLAFGIPQKDVIAFVVEEYERAGWKVTDGDMVIEFTPAE